MHESVRQAYPAKTMSLDEAPSTIISEAWSIKTPPFVTTHPTIYGLELHQWIDELSPTWARRLYGEHAVTAFHLENVFVLGNGLIFDSKLRVLRRFISQQIESDIISAVDCAKTYADGIHFIERSSMVLVKPGYTNYGHWLTELLVPASLIRRRTDDNICIFVCEHQDVPTDLYDQSLSLAGISLDNIYIYDFYPKFFKSLFVVSGHVVHGDFMSPLVISELRRICSSKLQHQEPQRRIYVRRGGSNVRQVQNEPELINLLNSLRFETIEPENLTLASQIEAFSSCHVSIGVAGAGLTNICWQPKGSASVGLFPAGMPDTFFWWIAEHQNVQFADVRCRMIGGDWNSHIEVDLNLVETALLRAITK